MTEQTITVLLVEDSPTDAKLTQLDLRQARGFAFEVTVAICLHDALYLLQTQTFDIVLLDLALPDSTGFATFKELQAKHPKLPIVVLTSGEDEAVGLEAIRNGAQDYLTKGSIDGKAIVMAIRYAIERKNMEEKLHFKIAELAFANKELEAFSYSVSHDVRSPLQGILGLSNVLQKQYGPALDTDANEMMGMIIQSAHRISEITDDLLSLSKISLQKVQRKQINASDLAQTIIDELIRSQPDRQADFKVTPDLDIHADPGLARILLENILRNAWKYSSKRTVTSIEFGCTEISGQRELFVKDNGAGFNMEHADRLFKPFQRIHTNAEFKGTGIGLSIVKRIIDKHSGTIRAESLQDEGATFFFTLE